MTKQLANSLASLSSSEELHFSNNNLQTIFAGPIYCLQLLIETNSDRDPPMKTADCSQIETLLIYAL